MSNDVSRIQQHCVRKYIKFNQFVWQNRTLNFFIETIFFSEFDNYIMWRRYEHVSMTNFSHYSFMCLVFL